VSPPEARVLSLPARAEADEIVALMLAQLLNARGISAKPVSASALASERLEAANGEKIQVVGVTTVTPNGGLHARYLCKRLREQSPGMRIVIGMLARGEAPAARKRELSASADEITTTLSEAVKQIQALVSVPAPGQTAFSS
jgi:DNA-binding response OmpR family regulator